MGGGGYGEWAFSRVSKIALGNTVFVIQVVVVSVFSVNVASFECIKVCAFLKVL